MGKVDGGGGGGERGGTGGAISECQTGLPLGIHLPS